MPLFRTTLKLFRYMLLNIWIYEQYNLARLIIWASMVLLWKYHFLLTLTNFGPKSSRFWIKLISGHFLVWKIKILWAEKLEILCFSYKNLCFSFLKDFKSLKKPENLLEIGLQMHFTQNIVVLIFFSNF